MGNSNAKKIEHDPGPEGPSGEGTTTLLICLGLYLLTAFILIRKYFFPTHTRVEEDKPKPIEVAEKGGKSGKEGEEDDPDQTELEKWTHPVEYNPSPEFRAAFIRTVSLGMVKEDDGSAVYKLLYTLSGVNYAWWGLAVFVLFLIFAFLLALSMMGTGFKLLGGKDSAKMFDVVDNPISGLMVGILVTVLVQSSSTSTSIIISLVGADELSVRNAIPMVMGANIGTSVTNTIVALGHFADPGALRRGFAAATVHDCFNLLSVAVILPLQWASGFLQEMTYEMAKDQTTCDEDLGDNCNKQEFVKPYLSPYVKNVASYDKKVAGYVAEGYCDGQCKDKPEHDVVVRMTAAVCPEKADEPGHYDCGDLPGYRSSWMEDGHLKYKRLPQCVDFSAGAELGEYLYACPDSVQGVFHNATTGFYAEPSDGGAWLTCEEYSTGLCDKRLLKGGIMLDNWHMTDEGAGTLLTIASLATLCCCLFLIIMSLQTLVKGVFARMLQQALSVSGYLSIVLGAVITIFVQSSSITTSTITPLAAVGVITLEQIYPITLGANLGTTLTGIMAATVVTSNAVAGWQVALCHLFFNIFGILIWYPLPKAREVPLNMSRFLGKCVVRFGPVFAFGYTGVVFFIIPAICYGIAKAATS